MLPGCSHQGAASTEDGGLSILSRKPVPQNGRASKSKSCDRPRRRLLLQLRRDGGVALEAEAFGGGGFGEDAERKIFGDLAEVGEERDVEPLLDFCGRA